MEAAHRIGVERGDVVGGGQRGVVRARTRPDGDDVRDEADACGLLKEPCGDRAERDPGGGLAGGGTVQDGRASSKPYLRMPTRSAWPGAAGSAGRCGPAPARRAGNGVRRHHVRPLRPLAVAISIGDRATLRHPVPDAGDDAHLVRSNVIRAPRPYPSRRRARAAATSAIVTSTPAGSPPRIPIGRAVRLPGSQPTQHARHPSMTPDADRPASARRTAGGSGHKRG